jgi:hypothetical protein
LSPEDSTSNYYIAVYPPKLPWKGYLILLPGMFQKVEDVLVQTDLPQYAAQQGLFTIIATLKPGVSYLGFDNASQSSLVELISHLNEQHHLHDHPLYLGGFSIGGTCAIKYAELALRTNFKVKPAAIFAIDSPLDFERQYAAMLRELRLPGSGEEALAESNYVIKRVKKEMGGTPTDHLSNYYLMSPYTYSDTTQYAIKPLVNLPIRLYTEPDILWWLGEGVDYSLMNAFDLAAMTNELKRLGNQKIELIPTSNKGFRKPGDEPHPHSWSIAESKDLVKWLLSQR